MKETIKRFAYGAAIVAASAIPAFADDFYTVPSVSTTAVGTLVTAVLAALALVWGARKGIKMINRS